MPAKQNKKYLVVIAGPTAVGKTGLAIELARQYGSVILSADSRQFYRELNIGTAKPSQEQLAAVSHYFINNKSIGELYGAGHFEKDAIQTLHGLFKQHDLVFMVGGSGLYIDAVLNGVDDFIEVPAEVRAALSTAFTERGLQWLQAEVKTRDEAYYNAVDTNNPQRLLRALEVCMHTGLPYSSFLNNRQPQREFTAVKILLNSSREQLYARINARVDDMMRNGLLQEAMQFAGQKHLNALKTVGYKEVYSYLDGNCSLEAAVDLIKQHTRNYAKRQLTWFKNKDRFETFDPREPEKIKAYIDANIQD